MDIEYWFEQTQIGSWMCNKMHYDKTEHRWYVVATNYHSNHDDMWKDVRSLTEHSAVVKIKPKWDDNSFIARISQHKPLAQRAG